MKRLIGRFAAVLVLLLVAHRAAMVPAAAAAEDQPICTIAALSNPYLTTASAKELGRNRSFLAKTAPAGLQRAIAAVNRFKPDALVVLGSLTWTGSDADFALVKAALSKVEVPWYVTPGERDLAEGGLACSSYTGWTRYLALEPDAKAEPAMSVSSQTTDLTASFTFRMQKSPKRWLLPRMPRQTRTRPDSRSVLFTG